MDIVKRAINQNVALLRMKATRFAIYGVVIATCAVILATIGTDYVTDKAISIDGFWEAQKNSVALWVLDLMPFVFGFWGQKVSFIISNEVNTLVEEHTGELIKKTTDLERQAMHEATHDALTDLPNRILLRDRLEQSLLAATRGNHLVGLLILDVDSFKEINDVMGHDSGDLLLKHISVRLRELVRSTDTLSRLGGDEFAIVLSVVNNEKDVHEVCNKIQEAFSAPFQLNNMDLEVNASVGAAIFPKHGKDADSLLQKADIAMYVAKDEKRHFHIYDTHTDKSSSKRLSLLSQMRQAIINDEMELYYQPKVEACQHNVVGAEALIRWMHPDHGIVPPDEFIQLAEQSGLIINLTHWVIRKSAIQIENWRKRGIQLSVSVNLSPSSLLDTEFPDFMSGLLANHRLSRDALILEITETTLARDPELALNVLSRLQNLGLQISIDDFGTGYSSLAYMKNIPATELKIDRAFVEYMLEDESDMAIVKSTIDLAHNLRMKVVAEGVEKKDVASKLCELGCDVLQGYFFSRPLPLSDFEDWLNNDS